MNGRVLLTLQEVFDRLRVSRSAFYRNRPALEAKGFPAPVAGLVGRYDPVAIDRWLDGQMPPALRQAAEDETHRPLDPELVDWSDVQADLAEHQAERRSADDDSR